MSSYLTENKVRSFINNKLAYLTYNSSSKKKMFDIMLVAVKEK